MRYLPALLALILVACDSPADGPPAASGTIVIQDFEGHVPFNVYPKDAKASLSTDWAADGKQSLKIGREAMVTIEKMATHDWNAYQVWRIHTHVPGKEGVSLGLEVADNQNGYLNRHQNAAAAPAGDGVVDIDISGDLWRGEVNKPYRLVKTPIDKHRINRFSITAHGGDVYVDRIELVKVARIAADGAWALQFCRVGAPTQSQWIAIHPGTAWDESKGYGMSGGTDALKMSAPYPTPVLGGGLIMNDARVQVRLKGGRYLGWALFERSGFWDGEQAHYRRARIIINGKEAWVGQSQLDEPYFLFQDLEVLNQEEVVHKLVMARQGQADFAFDATAGRNSVALAVEGARESPPRLAGLVLAPDTDAGRGFMAAHKKLQYDTIARTHHLTGRQNRLGDPTRAAEPLLIAPLPSDTVVYPGDWPEKNETQPIWPVHAMHDMLVMRLVGIYSSRPVRLEVSLDATALPADAARLWVNCYLPERDYDQTACWISTHHYRPARPCDAGPTLARAALVTMSIPGVVPAGKYDLKLRIIAADRDTGKPVAEKTVDVPVFVHPGTLAPLDMPSGLFFSGVPIPKEMLDDAQYWRLTEDMLRRMREASLTTITGGPRYQFWWEGNRPIIAGADCLRLIRLAERYGLGGGPIVGYGGLSLPFGRSKPEHPQGMTDQQAYAAIRAAWEEFAALNKLPSHYLNCYDEPTTDDDFASLEQVLRLSRQAGFKTLGFTSMDDPDKADANHRMLARETFAPAFNSHSPATLKYVRDMGNEPWIYNNGLDRTSSGVDLWRARRAGAAGRLQWIAAIVQGFQYDALDGREPDPSCFYMHSKLGVLFAPRYLASVEGGFDARLLFELQRREKVEPAAAGKIGELFKEIESVPYRQARSWAELQKLRLRMIELLTPPPAARGEP